MKAITRLIFVDDDNKKFFGEGPYRLLKGIEETGSLRASALKMEMAYTKALKLVSNAEKELGIKFTTRVVGGKSGGGSQLTPEAIEWLAKYERFRDACLKENERLYREYYGE